MVLVGIAALLIVVIIGIVALAFLGDAISETFEEIDDSVQKQKESEVRNPEPTSGVWLCDLIIVAGGDIDDRPFNFAESFVIKMGDESESFPQALEYEWKNCYVKDGGMQLNSFLPAQFFGPLLDFAVVIGDSIVEVNLELTGKDDKRVITHFDEKGLKEIIRIEGGLVQLPKHWETVHLVEDIVCQDYKVEVKFPTNEIDSDNSLFAGAEIAGTPYVQDIQVPDPKFGVCIDE